MEQPRTRRSDHGRLARRAGLAGFLALVAALLVAGIALAHASLARAVPAPDTTVKEPPAAVQLWFTEPVVAGRGAIRVTGPDGRRVDRRDARVIPTDAKAVQAGVDARAQGTYLVQWNVLSDDSHPIGGAYEFHVGAPSSVATQTLSAVQNDEATPGLPWQAAGRWVHLLGLVVALGPLVFGLLALGRSGDAAVHQRLWSLSRFGALLLVVAAPLMLLAQSVGLAGSIDDALRLETLRALQSSRWGVLWGARLALSLLLLGVAVVAARHANGSPTGQQQAWLPVGLAVGVALTVLTSLTGHPASTNPVVVSVLVDAIHLGASVAWIGGLLALSLVVLSARTGRRDHASPLDLRRIVLRFSNLALVSVALLILTGSYHTLAQVQGPAELVTTGYGLSLLVKLALVVAVLGLGAVNLLAVRSQLAASGLGERKPPPSGGAPWERYRRVVGLELLLGVAILAAVALLTSLPSARSAPAADVEAAVPDPPAPAAAVVLAQNVGTTLVTLAVDPAQVGSNQMVVTLQDGRGPVLTNARVRLRAQPLEESGGAASSTTMASDQGRYRATVSLAPAGRWRLEVLVALAGKEEVGVPFAITVPTPGAAAAAEWLERADRTMGQLRSLVEENTLAGGTSAVKTRYEYLAPNRVRYRLESPDGVAESILAGGRGYLRRDDGAWQSVLSPATASFRWPDYRFAAEAAEAIELGQETVRGVECVVVAYLDPRSGAHHRLWIAREDGRVLQHTMMGVGHYMTSAFSAFDRPLVIEPPTVAPTGQ